MTRPYQRLPKSVDVNWLIHRCAEVGITHAEVVALFDVSVSAIDKRLSVLRQAEQGEEIPGQLANDDWVRTTAWLGGGPLPAPPQGGWWMACSDPECLAYRPDAEHAHEVPVNANPQP